MMLEIKDLVKKYRDFRLECSLQVKPGQITGLIGENGSGKSTTFKSMTAGRSGYLEKKGLNWIRRTASRLPRCCRTPGSAVI